jgi:hypothetical protein
MINNKIKIKIMVFSMLVALPVSAQTVSDNLNCKINLYIPSDYGFNNDPQRLSQAGGVLGLLPALALEAANDASRAKKLPELQKVIGRSLIEETVLKSFSMKFPDKNFSVVSVGADKSTRDLIDIYRDSGKIFGQDASCDIDFLIFSVAVVRRQEQTHKGWEQISSLDFFGEHRISFGSKPILKSKPNKFDTKIPFVKNWPPKDDAEADSYAEKIRSEFVVGVNGVIQKINLGK